MFLFVSTLTCRDYRPLKTAVVALRRAYCSHDTRMLHRVQYWASMQSNRRYASPNCVSTSTFRCWLQGNSSHLHTTAARFCVVNLESYQHPLSFMWDVAGACSASYYGALGIGPSQISGWNIAIYFFVFHPKIDFFFVFHPEVGPHSTGEH